MAEVTIAQIVCFVFSLIPTYRLGCNGLKTKSAAKKAIKISYLTFAFSLVSTALIWIGFNNASLSSVFSMFAFPALWCMVFSLANKKSYQFGMSQHQAIQAQSHQLSR